MLSVSTTTTQAFLVVTVHLPAYK